MEYSVVTMEHENREYQYSYLVAWEQLLHGLLGWPAERTRRWAQRWIDRFNDGACAHFSHETPMYYVGPLLISKSGRDSLSFGELMQVIWRLEQAIYAGRLAPEVDANYDWNAARERIGRVLAEFELEWNRESDWE
jgi:hypothetical protein